MVIFRRGPPGSDVTDSAGEVARQSSGGGRLTALVSGIALLFSGFSFYQTVVKQPDLHVYVPPVFHLGRDETGKLETISVPITISNRGAREGAILSVDLQVRSKSGDKERTFYSAYFGSRPKAANDPFAPIAVPGRSSYSGTVLFYPKDDGKNIILEKGDYQLKITLTTRFDDTIEFVDKFWRPKIEPLEFSVVLPEFPFQDMLRGRIVRMHNVNWTPATGSITRR